MHPPQLLHLAIEMRQQLLLLIYLLLQLLQVLAQLEAGGALHG